MSNLFSLRRWERPDRPQPVYTGALNLWEAYRYVPIGDETRNSYRTPDRVSDRTYLQQTSPAFSWVQPVVDRVVSTWLPVFDAETSFRTDDRARLDVRTTPCQPQDGWLFAAQPSTASVPQELPAILLNLGLSYRAPERPRLDVRGYEWAPSFAWAPKVVDGVVSTWLPVFDAEPSFQTTARATLDVRTTPSQPQDGWLFSAQPPAVTVAQQLPAFIYPASYRSGERARLDVRGYDWSPSFAWAPKVVDGIVAKWIAVFDAEVSMRTADDPRLDVRRYDWFPSTAWIYTAQSTAPASVFVSNAAVTSTSDGVFRTTSDGDVRTTE